MKTTFTAAAISLLIALVGCFGVDGEIANEPPAIPDQTDDGGGPPASPSRPAEKTDTIGLEGSEESFRFTLYDSPALGLSTYIVEDFVVDEAGSDEGDGIIVYANFADTRNEDAYVSIFSPNASTNPTVESQGAAAKSMLKADGYDVSERTGDSPRLFAGSGIEYGIVKQQENGHYVMGTAAVFERNGRVYRVIVHHPEDWSEGFLPRANKMIEDMMWYD